MTFGNLVKLYLLTVPVFFVIDLLWLGVVARGFYRAHLGHLLRDDVRWIPAVVFYLLFIAGLVVFVIAPAVERQSFGRALLLAAFFGLVTYATYDLTNLALTKGFPTIVAVVDMAWGMVLATIVAAVSFKLAEWLL